MYCKKTKKFFLFRTQHDYILIHDQNTKHHSKLIAIIKGFSFALHVTKDIDIPREMENKKAKKLTV